MEKTMEAAMTSKVVRCVLAILIAASTAFGAVTASGGKAFGAESANLTVGGKIHYAGYTTTWMYADGEIAYCGNPSAATPPAGNYSKSSISAPSGRNAETVADLWFGYGSPGFDKSLWPSTWYDGSAMTDSRYAALAHILLSDTFSSNGDYALFGCNAEFKSWCRQNVIGFDSSGNMCNANATGRLIAARQGEVPKNFEAFMLYTGAGNQLILSFKYIPYGEIDLVKVTENPSMCEGNPLYSLEGAEYTVYSNEGLTEKAGVIVTDKQGYGKLGELFEGDYWVMETKRAPGHALDPTVYKTHVTPDETTRVNTRTVSDIAQSDPVGMLVGKIDGQTGESVAQGDATLEGALFTVRYYAGDYSTAQAAEASGEPARTWVFETDADGFAYYAEEYKHSGDALFYQTNGDASIPLGTILIQETRAPQGYNLDDGHGGDPKVFCVRITEGGAQGESVYTYNSPQIPDRVKHGDFRLVKEVSTTVYSEPDGDMPQEVNRYLVPGVKFERYDGTGNRVCTIVTDENGLATTLDDHAKVNGWSKPADWTGALAYGTYTVHEVIPEHVAEAFKAKWGKDLIAVPDWKTIISEEGQYDPPQLVNNHIPQTPLKIEKVDAETGKRIPLPCSFQLLDANGDLVTYTSHYPDTQVLDTWTANERGELTLPMLLEQGDYTLVEVEAPFGYVKELEGKVFTVGADYKGWDDPLVVEFSDMPQKATITVAKSDGWTGEPVEESVYIVKAAEAIITLDGTVRATEGEIVATLTTGADGKATSPELYLGTYTVYEAKATDGYALDVAEKTVVLDYAGQDVAVYDHEEAVTDLPTDPELLKVDALDHDTALAGAKFHIWNDEGTFDEELVTDEEGKISLAYAKHGSYHIQEVEAPEGYAITDVDEEGNPTVVDFKVNDQGMIEWDDTGSMAQAYTFELENMPKTMKTTATDPENGAHETQARDDLTIVDTIEYTGLVPGNEYTATGVLMDKATGEPATDDEGNAITASSTFVAEDSCGTVDVTFTFKGASLAGKLLVAFETMEFEGVEYMVHADIDDVDQTVAVVDIATQARDGITNTSEGTCAENGVLVDTVAYTGLTPGKEYRIFTTLMEKASGTALVGDDGLPRVGMTTFTPETPNGTIDITVSLDTRELAGKSIVFFEKLTDESEAIIAVHEDIDDEGQTVTFPEEVPEPESPGKGYPKTGGFAEVDPVAASLLVIAICGCAGAGYAYIRRSRNTAKAIDALEKEVIESADES